MADSNYGIRLGYSEEIFDSRFDYIVRKPLFELGNWIIGFDEVDLGIMNCDNSPSILYTAKDLAAMTCKAVVALNIFPFVAAVRAIGSRKLEKFPEGYRLEQRV